MNTGIKAFALIWGVLFSGYVASCFVLWEILPPPEWWEIRITLLVTAVVSAIIGSMD